MDINETTAPQETIYAPFKPDEEAPYIFISYSHRDRDRVFPIITRLYEKGWRVWYDEGLEVTENYYTSLSRHIKNCTVFLLFVTENSVKSEFVCEHELLLATSMRKRIAICRLDEGAEFTDEAKDAIDIAAVSKKNPKTDEAGLEAALEGIEELPRFGERKAEGFKVRLSNVEVLAAPDEDDEYEYEKCKGGVRLIRYNGKDADVVIPKMYKGHDVVELFETFHDSKDIVSVHIPETVRMIRELFFDCPLLTDVFIPSSVVVCDSVFWGLELNGLKSAYFMRGDDIRSRRIVIHCAENSAAYRYASEHLGLYFSDGGVLSTNKEDGLLSIEIDPLLEVKEPVADNNTGKGNHFAFCSHARDTGEVVQQIIQRLSENGCSVVSSSLMNEKEKNKSYRKARCMIAFVSQGYIDEDEVDYLYRAIAENKPFIIYALDNCALPDDINIAKIHDQQLRFDNGTEEDRLTKLIEWLDKNECVRTFADIPDYEYKTDVNGNIILTSYTGKEREIIIPSDFGGHPIIALEQTFRASAITKVTIPYGIKRIGHEAFMYCRELAGITIADSVTEIGHSAFVYCDGLSSLTLPDSITVIEDYAFVMCHNLTSINLNYGLERIGIGAFEVCNNLISLTIPETVLSIGTSSFEDCYNLRSLTITGMDTRLESVYMFDDCDQLTVYCHKDSEAWKYCEENDIPHQPIDG